MKKLLITTLFLYFLTTPLFAATRKTVAFTDSEMTGNAATATALAANPAAATAGSCITDIAADGSVEGEVDVWTETENTNAGYAPIDSPTFTTAASGPTPAENDNDTSLATTAFTETTQNYLKTAEWVASSTTVAGKVELAITSEMDAGVDTTRAMGVNEFNHSDWAVREIQVIILDDTTAVTVADGLGDFEWTVPTTLAGYNIVDVECGYYVAGTTGTGSLDLYNITGTGDILSTNCTIDTGELNSFTAAAPPVIDGAQDDLAAGDRIRFDSDVIHTTAGQGVWFNLTVRKP